MYFFVFVAVINVSPLIPDGGKFNYRKKVISGVNDSLHFHLYSSCRALTEEHRRLSLEEESVWLRIRSLTLRLLASLALGGHASSSSSSSSSPAQQNSETTENGVGDKACSLLASLLSQLEHTLQSATQLAKKCTQVGFITKNGINCLNLLYIAVEIVVIL